MTSNTFRAHVKFRSVSSGHRVSSLVGGLVTRGPFHQGLLTGRSSRLFAPIHDHFVALCPPWSPTEMSTGTNEVFGFIFAELLSRLLEQQGRKLHRLDVHTAARSNAFRDRFEALERSRC